MGAPLPQTPSASGSGGNNAHKFAFDVGARSTRSPLPCLSRRQKERKPWLV